MKQNTLLVPLDFSRVSRAVVLEATRLARLLGSRIVLLNVTLPPAVVAGYVPLTGNIAAVTQDMASSARNHLNRYRAKLLDLDIPTETVVKTGAPVREIIVEAKRRSAAYIVIGSHGHTAMYDLVVGSITHGVLKRAPCPVIVVSARAPLRRTTVR